MTILNPPALFDLDPNNLSPELIEVLNQAVPLISGVKRTPIIEHFLRCTEDLIFLETGNQWGKTFIAIFSYILRIFGLHPVEFKNLRPHCSVRTIRFASEKLPLSPEEGADSSNTIYPTFKKLFPPFLIKKDITSRNHTMTLVDPQGGPPIMIEYVSYTQPEETQAGTQRFSVYLDENVPKAFFDEQKPRLWATKKEGYGGDIIMSLTPAKYLGWQHSEVYEKASIYIRTPRIRSAIKRYFGKEVPLIEKTDQPTSIAVIQAATDDGVGVTNTPVHCISLDCLEAEKNGIAPQFVRLGRDFTGYEPFQCVHCGAKFYGTLDKDCIEWADDDIVAIRRFGISKQVMGTIFKNYDESIHSINPALYFPDGKVPKEWLHARAIDYHTMIRWAIVWVTLSPQNEVFVYKELNPDPRKTLTMNTTDEIIDISENYHYYLNLIDPLAAEVNPDTGESTLDVLNRLFRENKNAGRGAGGIWQTWDTKSDVGRDEVRKRLTNSRLCGKPFNNNQVDQNTGETIYLPTIWIFNTLTNVRKSLKLWREQQWADRDKLITNDEKGKPEGKNSHFPMCLEGLFKHPAFRISRYRSQLVNPRQPIRYFQNARIRSQKKEERKETVLQRRSREYRQPNPHR